MKVGDSSNFSANAWSSPTAALLGRLGQKTMTAASHTTFNRGKLIEIQAVLSQAAAKTGHTKSSASIIEGGRGCCVEFTWKRRK